MNWWESAPVVNQTREEKWWMEAPLANTAANAADAAMSFGSGFVRGVPETVEFLGAATATLPSAAISAARGQYKGMGQEFQSLMQERPFTPAMNMVLGEPYQPQTDYGRYAKSMGAGLSTGAIGGVAGAISGLAGGAGAEGGGDIAASTLGENYRVGGNILGGVLGGLGAYRYSAQPIERGVAKTVEEFAPMQGKPLAQMKEAAYQAVDESKAAVGRTAVKDFVEKTKQSLKRQGYVESAPEYAPITRKLEELATKPQADLTPAGFDAWLKGVGDIAAGDTNSTRLGGILKRETNKFLENIEPNQMAYGRAEDAKLVRQARLLNAQYMRDLALEDAMQRVRTRGASVSEEVAIKNEFRRLSRDSDFMAGLPNDVKEAVTNAAETGSAERLLRKIGGLSPTSGRLGAALGGAAGVGAFSTGNPALAIPAAIGFVADEAASGIASKQASRAADAVRRMTAQTPTMAQRASGLARNIGKEFTGNVKNDLGVLSRSVSGKGGFIDPTVFRNKLPADHASRMARAREQGFDVDNPVYHGTNKDFNSVDINKSGKATGAKDGAFWVSSNPEIANFYSSLAGTSGGTPNTIKGFIRGNILNANITRDVELGVIDLPPIKLKTGEVRYGSFKDTAKFVQMVRDGKANFILTPRDKKQILKHAKENGFDGVVFKDVIDGARNPSDVTAIFNSKNIRSVNAMFDQAKKDSSNLLAGTSVLGLTGLLSAQKADAQELGAAGLLLKPNPKTPVRINITRANGK